MKKRTTTKCKLYVLHKNAIYKNSIMIALTIQGIFVKRLRDSDHIRYCRKLTANQAPGNSTKVIRYELSIRIMYAQ